MLFEIDTLSAAPIYGQIAACVRRAIADGSLKPGSKLPPSRDLARELDVNMHTVQRAYSELRDEGLLELRQGRGAIVSSGHVAPSARLNSLIHDLLHEADSQGLTTAELARLMATMR
jgi:DNA-binding transcriptional regulator YhcF (GntR family)